MDYTAKLQDSVSRFLAIYGFAPAKALIPLKDYEDTFDGRPNVVEVQAFGETFSVVVDPGKVSEVTLMRPKV